MSHLIPERRVDKTGKSVIRHVKAASPGTSGSVVPPPVSTLKQDAAKIARRLSRGDAEKRTFLRGKLEQMKLPSTIQLIKDTLDAVDGEERESLCRSMLLGDEEYLRRMLYFREVTNRYSASVNFGMVIRYIDPPTDTDGNEAEIHRLIAMAHGICTVAEVNWMVTGNVNRVSEVHFEESDLIDVFVENPDRAVELSDYMRRRRGSFDAEQLRDYLGTHPALSDGYL